MRKTIGTCVLIFGFISNLDGALHGAAFAEADAKYAPLDDDGPLVISASIQDDINIGYFGRILVRNTGNGTEEFRIDIKEKCLHLSMLTRRAEQDNLKKSHYGKLNPGQWFVYAHPAHTYTNNSFCPFDYSIYVIENQSQTLLKKGTLQPKSENMQTATDKNLQKFQNLDSSLMDF